MKFIQVKSDQDISKVANLANEIWNDYYSKILSLDQIDYMLENLQSYSAIAQSMENDELNYYLLDVDGLSVGYCAYGVGDRDMLLSKCYILKDHRGKGYFSLVLDHLEAQALSLNKDQLKLYVNKYNQSLKIYEHFGFEINGSYQFDIGHGYIMDDYEMIKHIEKRA